MSALTDAVTRLNAASAAAVTAIANLKAEIAATPPPEDTTADVTAIDAASAALETAVNPPAPEPPPAEVETPAEDATETAEEPAA